MGVYEILYSMIHCHVAHGYIDRANKGDKVKHLRAHYERLVDRHTDDQ